MTIDQRCAWIDATLTRAAEFLGDITPAVMAAFYRAYPEALPLFEECGCGQRAQLEGRMVENSLFCLMRWVEARREVEILLGESVPHHNATLAVSPAMYRGFLECTAVMVGLTIPADAVQEAAAWESVRGELRQTIDACERAITQLLDAQTCSPQSIGSSGFLPH